MHSTDWWQHRTKMCTHFSASEWGWLSNRFIWKSGNPLKRAMPLIIPGIPWYSSGIPGNIRSLLPKKKTSSVTAPLIIMCLFYRIIYTLFIVHVVCKEEIIIKIILFLIWNSIITIICNWNIVINNILLSIGSIIFLVIKIIIYFLFYYK